MSLSLFTFSATALINLIIPFARLYPAADFAPKINVLGSISKYGFSFNLLYKSIIWSTFNSCLLYSCSLLTWISKIEWGFTSIPVVSFIYLANFSLLCNLISETLFNMLSSSKYCSNFLSSYKSVIHLSPINSVINAANSGFAFSSHLLWVIPFVLFRNFSGYNSFHSFNSLFLRISVCSAATPFTLCDPTIASHAILTCPFPMIDILLILSQSPGYFCCNSAINLLLISSIIW